MFKKFFLIMLIINLAACGTIMNQNKPKDLNHYELNKAVHLSIVEYSKIYVLGNAMMMLIAVPFTMAGGIGLLGFVGGGVGLFLDSSTNANYKIVDMEKYKNFKEIAENRRQQRIINYLWYKQ